MSQENYTNILSVDGLYDKRLNFDVISTVHEGDMKTYSSWEKFLSHISNSVLVLSWGKVMFSSSELQKNKAKCDTALPIAVIDICYYT